VAEDCLAYLAPLDDLALERIHRPLVEDLLAEVATHAPRRAEMSLTLLKRVLKWAEERGQHVDRAIYGIRERDGLSWPHYDGLIWPHPRPIASRAFGLFGARAGGRREDGIEGGAVREDP
jgi:hypothetical protein